MLSAITATGLIVHGKGNRERVVLPLRHTYATLLVRAGVGLPILQELLGHSHIQTTMIYLHISAADTAAAADKHPLAN